MIISKSYNFYYFIIPADGFNYKLFYKQSYFDYIFSFKIPFPEYIAQGSCDVLPNNSGILINQIVLNQLIDKNLVNDFDSCFAFNLPTEICDVEQTRYRKNYTFDFDIDKMKEEISMDLILHYDESPWKPILEINPDFFYLRNNNYFLIGCKDYKQIKDIIDFISNSQL